MRYLMVLRHAKAESGQGKPDRGRELTARGKADATEIGRLLHGQGLTPDIILTSDSVRTRQTAEQLQIALGPVAVMALPELYQSDPEDYLALVRIYASTANAPLIIGHNPTVEEFVSGAAGRDIVMKTAYLAIFELLATGSSDPVVNRSAGILRLLKPAPQE